MPSLRTQMTHDMTVRGLAKVTQANYLRAVTGLAQFYHCHPDTLSDREVQQYLVFLVEDRKLTWARARHKGCAA